MTILDNIMLEKLEILKINVFSFYMSENTLL